MDTGTFRQIQSSAGLSFDVGNRPDIIIYKILPYIFGVAGIVLIFNIISSGLKMMTSGGDPKALQGAQAKLSTSAIGVLILAASFWIVNLIMQFFGISFGGGSGSTLIN
jgi:hypothetical protein